MRFRFLPRKYFNPSLRRCLTISLVASAMMVPLNLLVYAPPAEAQSIWERISRLFSQTRPAGQASGRANGGAVRDELCSAEARGTSLVALVPQSNEGDTASPQPSFFFYVPYSSSQNADLVAEFMLLNEDRSYRLDEPLRVTLPETPGIVRVDLGETQAELDVGDRYNWYFSILCEDWELSRNPFVSGWVKRVAADTEETWHESLVEAQDAQEAQGGDRLTWESLLNLFDLEEFADKPVEPLRPLSP